MILSDTRLSTSGFPEAEYYLNPGLIFHDGGLLLAYRAQTGNRASSYICELFCDGNCAGHKKVSPKNLAASQFCEDMRLYILKNTLHCSFTCVTENPYSQTQGFCELSNGYKAGQAHFLRFGENCFPASSPASITTLPSRAIVSKIPVRPFEKNWAFFEADGKTYFIYELSNQTVVGYEGNKILETITGNPKFSWGYGIPRGGAPPIRIGDRFFEFFHSHLNIVDRKKYTANRQYFMGCCAFSAKPPFEILSYTEEPIAAGDPTGEVVLWKNAAVFPCGAVFRDGKWLVSYGYHDKEMRLMQIDHEKLLTKMSPLT